MEGIVQHFLPEIEKKITVGNWDISYTKSQATVVTDPTKLPDWLQKKTLVPKFDLMEYETLFGMDNREFEIETKAPLKEVKAWLEGLTDMEAKAVDDIAKIENRKKIKIK